MSAVTAGPKRTRQTYTRYQTLELEKVIVKVKVKVKPRQEIEKVMVKVSKVKPTQDTRPLS